ncbi:MAG: YegS/Rv2252/BmrU family lipid kinase [Clostridium sp.]
MKKVKFIYNPYSGENTILSQLDKVIKVHQKYGYTIIPFRISFECNMEEAFKDIHNNYEYVLVAGGDGTVDRILNIMMKLKIKKPLGIIPTGTANDFSKLMNLGEDIEDICEKIINSKPRKIDIGKINDKYFINVASAGLFTDISQKTDVNLKNTMGKLAYYLKGIEALPSFNKLKIEVTSKEFNYEGYMYLILVFNGKTAGNFKLGYKSEIDDGLLDVIIIKAGHMKDIISIFFSIIRGEHLEGVPGVIYFKTNKLRINCEEDIVTDIDGERGPDFPVTIECIPKEIKILGF